MKPRTPFLSGTISIILSLLASLSPAHAAQPTPDTVGLVRLDTIMPHMVADSALAVAYAEPIDAMEAIGLIHPGGLEEYVNSRAYTFFEPDVRRRFTATDSLSTIINLMSRNAANLTEPLHIGTVYGIISPYRQSVMTMDSTVFVALNHYLGPDYEAYRAFEPYTRSHKRPELIPYHIAEALLQGRLHHEADSVMTVRQMLLRDGQLAADIMAIVPNAKLQDVGGWTDSEFQWLEQNYADMLRQLDTEGVLDSIDQQKAAMLLTPGPASPLLQGDAPGNAGRYIGYRLLSSY